MPRFKKEKKEEEKKPFKKKAKFQSVRGMKDILPDEHVYFDYLVDISKSLFRAYDYQPITTPILEDRDLFVRGTGETTDVVEKEMFEIESRDSEKMVMRPEFTPGIMRAYLERGLTSWSQPVKLYEIGSIFRYDRPQAGRYREFNQIDMEIIGSSKPILDAEIIDLTWSILTRAGLEGLVLQINSIGSRECRKEYAKVLLDYLRSGQSKLCEDCKRRLKTNPLRVLDCKNEKCQRLTTGAPQIIDHLDEESKEHFKEVMEYLDEVEIPYNINPRLVRGLDYYTHTVFEVWPESTGDKLAQSSYAGGGRYDGLAEILGGRPASAVGVGIGMERVIMAMKEQGIKPGNLARPRVFLAQLGAMAKRKALTLYKDLFAAGIPMAQSFGRDSIKSQIKQADKIGVDITLILGQKEAVDEDVIIRDMKNGVQEVIPQASLMREIKKRLQVIDDEKQ